MDHPHRQDEGDTPGLAQPHDRGCHAARASLGRPYHPGGARRCRLGGPSRLASQAGGGMMTVLQRGLRFAEIAALAEAEGWRTVPITGLRPPLIPGEPELARFERGNEILIARFNPAVGLRVLEGPTLLAAPVLDARGIIGLIESPNPETALCGILAAEAAGM